MDWLINKVRLFYLLLFIISATIIFLLLLQYNLSYTFAITDALVSATSLSLSIWAGIITVNNYPTKAGLFVYAIFIGIVAGIVSWSLDKLVLKWWFDVETDYINWLQSVQTPRLIISILTTGWIITATSLNRKTAVLEEQFKTMSDAATLHREAELFKLRQQLQPHFLYNSLNSISALIMLEPDKAQEMIGKLSDFLRHSVKRESKDQIQIDEELDYIESYLSIEAVRFGDRLNVIYEKDKLSNELIPPFLLQPILENAIKFGLYGKTGTVTITISIKNSASYLVITVSNPYEQHSKPPSGTGFGLEGINRRLYLLYGRTDLLETQKNEETFITTLKIPQDHV